MSGKLVKFYYDIASLPSWILFEQLCAVERCFGAQFQFFPVRMAAIYNATGHRNPYYILTRRKQLFADVVTLRTLYGVPFTSPQDAERRLSTIGSGPAQHFLSHIALKHPNYLREVSRFLWKRLWIHDQDIHRDSDFGEAVRELELPSESVHVSDEKAESALKNAEKEAIEHGCFEVPFTIVQSENKEPCCYIGMDDWPMIAKKLELPSDHRGFYSLRSFNHLFERTDASAFA